MTTEIVKKMTKEQQQCHDTDSHSWFQVSPMVDGYCMGTVFATVQCDSCELRLYIEVSIDDLVRMTLKEFSGSSIEEYMVENNERL